MKPRIGIIEVGDRPQDLAQQYPSYAEMTSHWLAPLKGKVSVVPVLAGAELPLPSEADLWVITGSRHGVYEDIPWIAPLMEFIQQASQSKAKMLGICFGHQIIAQAMGGLAVKSDKGWGVGIFDYPILEWPDTLGVAPSTITLNAYHQDQVVEVPSSAKRLAGSDFCSNAVLWYPGFALTFQGHPEFTIDFESDLIVSRRQAGLLPESIAKKGLASLSTMENTRLELASWLAAYWHLL